MEVGTTKKIKIPSWEEGAEKTVRAMLACPVCDRLPVAPIYGCQNGHLICDSCKAKIVHCSVCRADRFNVRCLLAEELLATNLLDCRHKSSGCLHTNMTGAEFTNHVETCPYRPIECECKAGGTLCRNVLIRYDKYFEHLKDFHAAVESHDRSFLVCCKMFGPFTPRFFQCFGRQFLLLSHRNPTKFWTWVAIMENHEDCDFYMKIKLRFKVPNDVEQVISSDVITPSSMRMIPEDVVKGGQCLEFSATSIPTSAPPCVWPQYEIQEGEIRMEWAYDLEIWEQRKQSLLTGTKSTKSPSPKGGRNVFGTSPLLATASTSGQHIQVPTGLLRVAMAGTSHATSGRRSNVLHRLLVKPRPVRDLVVGDQASDDDSDNSYESNERLSEEEEGPRSRSEIDPLGSRRGSNDTSTSRDTPESKISQSHQDSQQGRRRSTPSGASDSGENELNELDEGEPGLKRKKYDQLVESEDSTDESENKGDPKDSNPQPKSSNMPAIVSDQNLQQGGDIQGIRTHEDGEIISPDPSPDSANNPPTPEPVHVSTASGSGTVEN